MDQSLQQATTLAVVGYAGRFPGAPDVESFWRNLRDGVESISTFSREQAEAAGADARDLADPTYVLAAGRLDDVESFDADFFGYSPREAELMDPQHRLFLETAWTALENAGYPPQGCRGAVGVYGGVSLNTYLLNNLYAGRPFLAEMNDLATLIGNDKDFLTTRVSYKLDLTGPSVVVQTACSTSLVAITQACQSLLTHQCDLALAGGVSVRVPQERGYLHVQEGIFSPDGHCRPFDARAAGTVFGNGVGIVVLKRLAQALEDRDTIHALVRGFAVNNDGAGKVGYTAPSVERQAEVVATAMAVAGVEPASVQYVEAHGTGTELGDPIEVAALNAAFDGRDRPGSCGLGSVKSNIGHLDAAAGVASFLKTVLALEHRQLPPSLHFERANPAADLASGPFYVNAALSEWPRHETPRRAGVSSLGIGGTNAHVVLEEAPEASEPDAPSRAHQIILLSARSQAALARAAAGLAEHLESNPAINLADAAYTLQVGRQGMPHRRTLVCRSAPDAAAALRAGASDVESAIASTGGRRVAFLFPGQGAQHPNMARGVYESEPVFRHHLDDCCEQLEPLLGRDLRELLFPTPESEDGAGRQIERTILAQPALFAVCYSLARLWMSWGVRPDAMLGHSIGELVAACLAEVFTLPKALELIAARGKLMQGLPGGAMLAVELSAEQLERRLGDGLALAAANAPTMNVVSGPTPALRELEQRLAAEGIARRRLHTSHAFHSPMIDPIVEDFAEAVRAADPRPPSMPFVSGLTGDWITTEQATAPDYWARQMRETVRFSLGLLRLTEGSRPALLEVGPGGTLAALTRSHEGMETVVTSLPDPNRSSPDEAHLARALGRLWLAGVEPSWSGYYAGEARRRVPLPTYPFERRRHWVEPRPAIASPAPEVAPPPGRSDLEDWFYVPSWLRAAPREPLPASAWEEARNWLVVGSRDGLAGRVAGLLGDRGQAVSLATPSSRFARLEDGVWMVNPLSRNDFRELLDELTASGRAPAHVLALAGAEPESAAADSIDLPLYSLVSLAQALGERSDELRLRLTVVTTGAHEVTGFDQVEPRRACITGFCRAIPLEYPSIDYRGVDLTRTDLEAPGLVAAERVLHEAMAAPEAGQTAYRGRHRWVPRLEAAPQRRLETLPTHLRQGGVYLITGGLGGLGLAFAEHLAREHRAKLILTGRRRLPPREEWNAWLDAHPESDPIGARIRGIRRLESLGAEVRVVAVDVADLEAMRAALEECERDLGAIRGVLHAAGTVTLRSIHELTPEGVAAVLRPKVQGTLVLDRLFEARELDFLVLFSSLAGEIDGVGLSSYTAANSFLDAYATTQSGRRDRRVLSLGWDVWRELGMAREARTPAMAVRLEDGLTAEEGLEVFRRALESEAPRLIISTQPLAPTAAEPESARSGSAPEAAPFEPPAGEPEPRPESLTVPAVRDAPRTPLEEELVERWQTLLGLERVGIHDNFFELGGHSLLATQLINRLRRDHPDTDLSLRALFDGPTVAELAQLIGGEVIDDGSSELRPRLSRSGLSEAAADRRPALLEGYLERQLADIERAAPADAGTWHDSAAAVAHLILVLESDLGLRTYPNELRRFASVPELAEFVLAEIEHQDGAGAPGPAVVQAAHQPSHSEPAHESPEEDSRPKNEPAAFLLSSPRSGSTLLRVMLSGHSRLFCPPELSLLAFRSMSGWSRDAHAELHREGLVRALAALLESDPSRAERRVAEMVEQDLSTGLVYAELQELAKPRKLLDKTPIYAYEGSALHRAEELFERPVYLHLTRHPHAVIDSFVRARFTRLRSEEGDPFEIAERYWRRSNRNVLDLANRIGRERCHLIQFEELVLDPEDVMRRLCAFLDLPFEEAVLRPYEAGQMLAGPGDPKLFARGRIEPAKADAWREVKLPRPLGAKSRELAAELGYPV